MFTVLLTDIRSPDVMSHICYEGGCAKKSHVFSSSCVLCQHEYRSHQDTPEEEMSLGNIRMLKCKCDAQDEEERERWRIEAQLALEAANREPEPQPVRQ